MKNTLFVSDLHLGHANILAYSHRPFSCVEEMDETIIRNWNEVVKPGDDVYFLGDFCMGNRRAAENYRRRLNGTIFFIEGNHDKGARQIKDSFAWYKSLQKVDVNGQEIVLCHFAMLVWNKSHYGAWNLYGHSHGSLTDDPNARSMDVGIDATAMREAGLSLGKYPDDSPLIWGLLKPENYRPISFEEVKAFMEKKTFKPIDHHRGEQNGRE